MSDPFHISSSVRSPPPLGDGRDSFPLFSPFLLLPIRDASSSEFSLRSVHLAGLFLPCGPPKILDSWFQFFRPFFLSLRDRGFSLFFTYFAHWCFSDFPEFSGLAFLSFPLPFCLEGSRDANSSPFLSPSSSSSSVSQACPLKVCVLEYLLLIFLPFALSCFFCRSSSRLRAAPLHGVAS